MNASTRFTKIDAHGNQLAADSSAAHAAVLDNNTGLIWSAGDVTDESVDHADATKACADLDLAGAKDWRLPTVDELQTILDRSRYSPAIDAAFFPNCSDDYYWTASPVAFRSSASWIADFSYGNVHSLVLDYGACVRAVRVSAPAGQ